MALRQQLLKYAAKLFYGKTGGCVILPVSSVCMNVCMCVCLHVYVFMYMCLYEYVCVYVCVCEGESDGDRSVGKH